MLVTFITIILTHPWRVYDVMVTQTVRKWRNDIVERSLMSWNSSLLTSNHDIDVDHDISKMTSWHHINNIANVKLSWSNKNTVNQRLNRSPTKITSSSLIWRIKSSLGWRLWRNGMILEYLTVLNGAKDRENEAGMHCCRYFWKEKYLLLLLLTSILIILNKRIFPEILCFLWNFWCPFT